MDEREEILAGRIGTHRVVPLQQLTDGTWTGTEEAVASLVQDSMHKHGWRPVRAACLLTLAEINDRDRVWMTPEEFAAWVKVAKAVAKSRKEPTNAAQHDLGLTAGRVYDLQRRERVELRGLKISKVEALACAHYAMGLLKPVPTGDADALQAWFMPRFGNVTHAASFLDVTDAWLGNRLRGWSLVRGQRKTVLPEGYLIRALDWLYRVGPICPYGDRPTVDLWPGQEAPQR